MAKPKKIVRQRIAPAIQYTGIYGQKITSMAFSPHTIFIVEFKDETLKESERYIPCLPYENQTLTYRLKEGTVVKFLEEKDIGSGNNFYVMEVLDTGDTVLVPPSFKKDLYRIYSTSNY